MKSVIIKNRLILVLFSFFIFCDTSFSQKQILGKWTNNELVKPVILTFIDSCNYSLTTNNGKFTFTGKYTFSDKKNLKLVDEYCGNTLPGLYTLVISNNKLSFCLVSDSFCVRNKIIPGTWEPAKDSLVEKHNKVNLSDTIIGNNVIDFGKVSTKKDIMREINSKKR